jgi:hypothetical protein
MVPVNGRHKSVLKKFSLQFHCDGAEATGCRRWRIMDMKAEALLSRNLCVASLTFQAVLRTPLNYETRS